MILGIAAALANDAVVAGNESFGEVLRREAERNRAELSLPEAPPLYHLRYQLLHLEQVDALYELGGRVGGSSDTANMLGVEVRVGTPAFDNTGFGGWQNGFLDVQLPEQLTPYTLSLGAWTATDRAYKQAVEQHARKTAQFTPPPNWPGDYTLTGAVRHDGGGRNAGAAASLEERARAVSAVFLQGGLPVERGEVHVGHEAGYLWTVDTEGTDVRRPMEETTIRALLHVRGTDGALLTDQLLWTVRSESDLPPLSEMVADALRMRDRLTTVAALEPEDDEYVGPVLFRDGAAADLFRTLLLPQLEGTPAEVKFESWFGDMGSEKDPVRVGRRVLPAGYRVEDDPLAIPSHPGSFTHDYEGTPAQAVELVTDGIVRTVLMNRVPRQGIPATNGHARGLPGQPSEARASILRIEPEKAVSTKKLEAAALRAAAAYGRDWVYVVDRLEEASVRALDGSMGFVFGGEDSEAFPAPVLMYRLHADGRQEPVRGLRFAQVPRFVLRDIQLAGEQVEADFMASGPGGYGGLGPTTGMPTHISAPEVLVGEVELVPMPGEPKDLPLLPPVHGSR